MRTQFFKVKIINHTPLLFDNTYVNVFHVNIIGKVKENHQEILNKLDPERKMYFLYSLDENPDWDMQEKLMNIGERFHLG